MLVTIREVTIDTQGETDMVLIAAQVTQTIRAALQQPSAITSHRIEPAAPAQIAAPARVEMSPAKEELPTTRPADAPSTNGKTPLLDKCACGRTKRAISQRCRHCAGIAARQARARKNAAQEGV